MPLVSTNLPTEDDPLGPARQFPPEETKMPAYPVSKPIQEEMKVPE